MNKRQLIWIGLFVYTTILVTSFLHLLHALLRYSHPVQLGDLMIPGWIGAVGVALGLDMAILYFSYLSVRLRGMGAAMAKQAAVSAMLLVWFAVAYSMVWDHLLAARWADAAVGFILSTFVPLTAMRIGQVLGALSEAPEEETAIQMGVRSSQSSSLAPPAQAGAVAAAMVRVENHIHTQAQPGAEAALNGPERLVMGLIAQGIYDITELAGRTRLQTRDIIGICGALEAKNLVRKTGFGYEAA
jgi:hypothetical protein